MPYTSMTPAVVAPSHFPPHCWPAAGCPRYDSLCLSKTAERGENIDCHTCRFVQLFMLVTLGVRQGISWAAQLRSCTPRQPTSEMTSLLSLQAIYTPVIPPFPRDTLPLPITHAQGTPVSPPPLARGSSQSDTTTFLSCSPSHCTLYPPQWPSLPPSATASWAPGPTLLSRSPPHAIRVVERVVRVTEGVHVRGVKPNGKSARRPDCWKDYKDARPPCLLVPAQTGQSRCPLPSSPVPPVSPIPILLRKQACKTRDARVSACYLHIHICRTDLPQSLEPPRTCPHRLMTNGLSPPGSCAPASAK